MSTAIQRLVVLMLENRSFDHMLGFLKRGNPAINGLVGNEKNPPAIDSRPDVQVSDGAGDVRDLDPDPGHDFEDVTRQIFGSLDSTQPATMDGFVQDYARVSNNAIHGENIMKCFKPETLPILATLATAIRCLRSLVFIRSRIHNTQPDVRAWRQFGRLCVAGCRGEPLCPEDDLREFRT